MVKADVVVTKLDNVFVKVECEQGISAELSDFFSFYTKNYQFSPLYRKKIWDGKVYLYSKKTNKLYGGLVRYLTLFCKEREYKYAVDPEVRSFNELTLEQVQQENQDLRRRLEAVESKLTNQTAYLNTLHQHITQLKRG